MTWSTRELADLAGTTTNTIRYYHRLGLLDEPERRINGYKQYRVPHLVRLLRIRRVAALGVPLSQVPPVGADTRSMVDVLQTLDAELEERIELLKQARTDIDVILREDAPADAPAGFVSVASQLSEADSSILHIYAQLYNEDAMADLRRMVDMDDAARTVGDEIAALPADADETTRQRLAEQLAPTLVQNLIDYPWLSDPDGHLSKSRHLTQQTLIEAVGELYDPAQIDVLTRAGAIAREKVRASRAA
ncbi:MerR family transcriptional regulator [Brachybacterium sp. FME24]|uniref:MerR family transcriptional regulator n=1 Tax=Brachybacterium sp. FME24 TaxID=2742605 RepID=UPI00186640EE|nr:MerR family transcriptional regulator [Brachybacterium sp. FME24]